MQLTRTTLRLRTSLKKDAEILAIEENTSLQEILNRALQKYLETASKNHARKLVIKTLDLGVPLDYLTRDDFYPDPKN